MRNHVSTKDGQKMRLVLHSLHMILDAFIRWCICLTGHMSSFGSASATATDAQSSSPVLFEDSHTDDLAVASPVVSCERHVVDSSKITCDEAPEFRPFLLGTGYC